jgi:hypothetical protein
MNDSSEVNSICCHETPEEAVKLLAIKFKCCRKNLRTVMLL